MRAAFLSVLLVTTASIAQAEITGVPDAFPAERYAKMREKSPFALATPAAAPAAPKADSFTKNLFLGGHVILGTENGVDVPWVSIKTTDGRENFTLRGNEPNEEGISIASLERSPIAGKSKVILKKGNEFGEVKEDEAGRAAAATQAAAQAEAQMQRANGKLQPPPKGGTRTINLPRPNTAPPSGAVPPPPAMNGTQATQPPPTGAAVPPPNSRRVRVIPSKPTN